MNKTKLHITILILFILISYDSIAQISLNVVEIKAIYKSKVDGRIIPEKEFQSFRGNYTYHKLIKTKKGKRDTILITPPKINTVLTKEKLFKNQIGKKIADFMVEDIYGNEFDSSQLKGKVVVLNFWFIACPPCIHEIPDLNKTVEKYKNNKDIVFIAFALDSEKKIGSFLSKTEFDYTIVPNAKNITKDFKVPAWPSHMVIDRKGIIQYTSVGLEKESIQELTKQINKELK